MSNTKSKTEIFEELSPKYFYDVSAEAAVKFLNSQGFDITTLEEMTDDMVETLYNIKDGLLKFARKNGLHNKPLPKVSPDEEKLRDLTKSLFSYDELKSIFKKEYEGHKYINFNLHSGTNYEFIRGLDFFFKDGVSPIGIKFKFMGCDEDSYFCIVSKLIEYYLLFERPYDRSVTSSSPPTEIFNDKLKGRVFYEYTGSRKEPYAYSLLVEVYFDENYDITSYDDILRRDRFFKIIKTIEIK